MTWRRHEDIALRTGFAVAAHINGVLSTWKDWRSVSGAVERLATCLDWIDPEEIERIHQTDASRPVRNNVPGWSIEDRARRHLEIMTLIRTLRSGRSS